MFVSPLKTWSLSQVVPERIVREVESKNFACVPLSSLCYVVVGSGVGNLLLRNSNHELCRISMAFENFDSKQQKGREDSLFEIIEEFYSWIALASKLY